jgi:hypothetical protein
MVYYCLWCEKKAKEWFSNWCAECREQKNLNNVYGFDRVLTIMKKCCIRSELQLENKINKHRKDIETPVSDKTGNDLKDYDNPDKIPADENKEYFLRRKQPTKSQYSK